MNNLVRGIQRSHLLQRANKHALSSESTAATTIIGARQWMSPFCQASSSLQLPPPPPPSSSPTTTRNFSSIEPQPQRNPSALEQANLPHLTPGHAIRILHIHGSNGINLLRRTDVLSLFQSSRPGKKKDAKVIATALKDFKRNNKFILHEEGARAAVDGMMRAMIPGYKVVYGRYRLEAAVFVLEQILDERTGLYFAVEVESVDGVLGELKRGLMEMEERGVRVKVEGKVDAAGAGADGEEGAEEGEKEENAELSEDEKLLTKAMKVSQDVTKMLIKRRSLPENNMKKRARRAYKKLMQNNEGPAMSTLTLATEISLMIGGSSQARENIIDPFNEAWYTEKWTSGVDQSIMDMISEAEKKEEEEKAAAAAAAEAAATSAEEADEGDDDGSEEVDSNDKESSAEEPKN